MRSIAPAPPTMGSRSLCALRDAIGDSFLRHLGIYGYRAGFIRRYVTWDPSPLEHIEMLEQLRVLWYGENSRRRGQRSARQRASMAWKIWRAFALNYVNPLSPPCGGDVLHHNLCFFAHF